MNKKILGLTALYLALLTGVALAEGNASVSCVAPEPISSALFVIGGGALLIRKFQKRK